jgi:Transcriptional Coactivator p15 (PC4)
MQIFNRNRRVQIRVEQVEFHGKKYLHIREWWREWYREGADEPPFQPGRGISLPLELAAEVLQAALAELGHDVDLH